MKENPLMTESADQAPPGMTDIPIGLPAAGTRQEFDSMGHVDVPASVYYGAQTARSLIHFSIGDDRMPKAVYHAYGIVKKACALVNEAAGRLPSWKAAAIVHAADEAIGLRAGQRSCRAPAVLEGGSDRSRRGRGHRGQARCAFSTLRLADRIGHPVEHERQ